MISKSKDERFGIYISAQNANNSINKTTVRVRTFAMLNFRVLGETASMLNFHGYKFSRVSAFFTCLDVAKLTHQPEVDKAPGKGLLLAVSVLPSTIRKKREILHPAKIRTLTVFLNM